MKNILFIVRTSFIGTHTFLLLMEKKSEVNIVDSFLKSSPKSLDIILENIKLKNCSKDPKLNIYDGNLRDKKILKNFSLVKFKKNYLDCY